MQKIPHPDLNRRSTAIIFGGLLLTLCLSAVAAVVYMLGVTLRPSHSPLPTNDHNAFSDVHIAAKAAFVYDMRTATVLYQKNEETPFALASITKIPLALVVAEVVPDDELITISSTAAARSVDLTAGEIWRAKDLRDFMLLASSNAAALALSEAADARLHSKYPETTPGRAAVDRMNDLAGNLGLLETHFLNPSGLDESKTRAGAVGSARDVADLLAYADRNAPGLFTATREEHREFAPEYGPVRTARNTNEIATVINGLRIGKTGTTPLATGNLAVLFEPYAGRPVVVVVLGGTESGRFQDVQQLVKAAERAVSGTN